MSRLKTANIDGIERVDVTQQDRLVTNLSGSKGFQPKWKKGNLIIKLDCSGYEGLSEVLVSWFLRYTNIPVTDYVEYKSCSIWEDSKFLGIGCYSEDFVRDSEEITLLQLMQQNLIDINAGYDEIREDLFNVVGFDIKSYVDRILAVDSITRNDDRHFSNIAFLYKEGKYIPAPIFDNGAACMSDLITYPIDVDFETNYKSILAKPFSIDFRRQLKYNDRLLVRDKEFLESVNMSGVYGVRAIETIKRGLRDMEGVAWERY